MPRPGGAHALLTPRDLTGRRAVGVTAITGGADGEQRAAEAAHFLAQRDVVHGVASAAVTSPGRTCDSVAQITAAASGGPWRVRGGHEGPEDSVSYTHLTLPTIYSV